MAEIFLRVAGYDRTYVNPLHAFHTGDPALGYRGRPSFSGRFHRPGSFDVEIVHDEYGFRLHEHDNDPAQTHHALYVFGDSTTWGWGVSQGACFTDRMNPLLPDYRILNRGLNASGTVIQYSLFEGEVLGKLEPGDVVLLMFSSNDFNDNLGSDKVVRAQIVGEDIRRIPPQRSFQSEFRSYLKGHSYLFNFINFSVDRWRLTRHQNRALRRKAQLVAHRESGPEFIITRHFLGEFHARCVERGAKFLLAYTPSALEYMSEGGNHPGREEDQALRMLVVDMCGSLGLSYVDLLPGFREAIQRDGTAMLTIENDGHWTARGHQVAAESLARYITTGQSQRDSGLHDSLGER